MQTTIDVFVKIKADDSQTPPPPPPAPPAQITPSTLIFFSIAVAVFCFVGFIVVFFCRCCFVNISRTNTVVRLSPIASPYRGLDPSLLSTFPTFLYATVKDLRKEKKYSLECAICLVEFDDDSMLRLLTACCHVFHQECIDLWLRSHKTCPFCRMDLETASNADMQKPHEQNEENVEEERSEHVCIDVNEGHGDAGPNSCGEGHNDGGEGGSMSVSMQREKFASTRSHSTGHSIVLVREGDEGRDYDNDDKYTLRLPEHVAIKIFKGHNYSKSCSSYKDMPKPSGAPCSNCGYVQTVSQSSSSNAINNA
ncbi:unnamed protein product [Sphenostylis stenocarpa]|uniref:RING-type E3 ubiquitin transferase n=1 Tax=Sphenostylis stenocarpa TaxID=92480 RepID=A0AA86S7M3_9FABA|nr:unnamed protein product [Sphenostylis stenocarpa]